MTATATNIARPVPSTDIAARVDKIDWTEAGRELDAQGCAVLQGLLSPEECRAIPAYYPDDKDFRGRIVMGRHGFGRGEYKYFSYPLSELIACVRPDFYAKLRYWSGRGYQAMGSSLRYPAAHCAFLK